MIAVDAGPDMEVAQTSTRWSVATERRVSEVFSGHSTQTQAITTGAYLQTSYSDTASSLIVITQVFDDLIKLKGKHSWVVDFFNEYGQLNSVSELSQYYKKINSLIMNDEHEDVDTLLRTIDESQCSDAVLVGLVRLTYSHQDMLSSWVDYKERAVREARRRNMDARALIGLT